jgi:hypothetical protein
MMATKSQVYLPLINSGVAIQNIQKKEKPKPNSKGSILTFGCHFRVKDFDARRQYSSP